MSPHWIGETWFILIPWTLFSIPIAYASLYTNTRCFAFGVKLGEPLSFKAFSRGDNTQILKDPLTLAKWIVPSFFSILLIMAYLPLLFTSRGDIMSHQLQRFLIFVLLIAAIFQTFGHYLQHWRRFQGHQIGDFTSTFIICSFGQLVFLSCYILFIYLIVKEYEHNLDDIRPTLILMGLGMLCILSILSFRIYYVMYHLLYRKEPYKKAMNVYFQCPFLQSCQNESNSNDTQLNEVKPMTSVPQLEKKEAEYRRR